MAFIVVVFHFRQDFSVALITALAFLQYTNLKGLAHADLVKKIFSA